MFASCDASINLNKFNNIKNMEEDKFYRIYIGGLLPGINFLRLRA